MHSPLGHDEVAIHRRPQGDVDAAHCVDVAEDEQHGPRHGLQHLHDALETLAGHLAHVGRLLSAQDVGQAQLAHADGPLQQHLAEEEVLLKIHRKNQFNEQQLPPETFRASPLTPSALEYFCMAAWSLRMMDLHSLQSATLSLPDSSGL